MIKKILLEKRDNFRKYGLLKDNLSVIVKLQKLGLTEFGSGWGCYSENILNRDFILYVESLIRGLNSKSDR